MPHWNVSRDDQRLLLTRTPWSRAYNAFTWIFLCGLGLFGACAVVASGAADPLSVLFGLACVGLGAFAGYAGYDDSRRRVYEIDRVAGEVRRDGRHVCATTTIEGVACVRRKSWHVQVTTARSILLVLDGLGEDEATDLRRVLSEFLAVPARDGAPPYR
jgi:hypothetical protein